jgi:hypothetical protein
VPYGDREEVGNVKKLGGLIVATAAVLLLVALPAHAGSGGKGFSGKGFSGKGVSGSGFKGHSSGSGFKAQSFKAQSRTGFAFRGRSGGFHGGHGHGHHHHGSTVFFGAAFAPVWWWGSPYYYPYYYPYPAPVYQQAPQVYVQQNGQTEPYYWYYCEGAQAYYPYVQQCPAGWMKVVPPSNGPKPE